MSTAEQIDVDLDMEGQRELQEAVKSLQVETPADDIPATDEHDPLASKDYSEAEAATESAPMAEGDDEAKARADGWVSKEEWVSSGKPADKWKPADEFNRHGAMYALHKGDLVAKIDEQARLTQEMARMFREQQEKAVAQARAEERAKLEEQMRDAWVRGDMDGYNKAVEQKVSLDKPAAPQAPAIDPAIQEWGARNPWFTNGFDEVGIPTNPAAADMAQFTAAYRQARPNEPAINAVMYAERKVKEKHADLFKPKAAPQAKAPAVSAGARGDSTKPASPNASKFAKLSSEEQGIVRQMAKASGMTIEQYMANY